MPKNVLEVGEMLFKTEKHPLLSSFHYLFERLASQSLHPRELRRFLRLDQPLCCTNLDEKADENNRENSGGPLPIHRVKGKLFNIENWIVSVRVYISKYSRLSL